MTGCSTNVDFEQELSNLWLIYIIKMWLRYQYQVDKDAPARVYDVIARQDNCSSF